MAREANLKPKEGMMGKKKVFLILLLCIILAMGVTLWSNATFRTIFRALFHFEYPVETQKIKNDIVEFDLSDKKPARLATHRYVLEKRIQKIFR